MPKWPRLLAIRVARRLNSNDAIDILSNPFILCGPPTHIRSDNGQEFIAKAVQAWITGFGAQTAYITPACARGFGVAGAAPFNAAGGDGNTKTSTTSMQLSYFRVDYCLGGLPTSLSLKPRILNVSILCLSYLCVFPLPNILDNPSVGSGFWASDNHSVSISPFCSAAFNAAIAALTRGPIFSFPLCVPN